MEGCAIVSACRRANEGAKRGVMRKLKSLVPTSSSQSTHVEDTLEADQT